MACGMGHGKVYERAVGLCGGAVGVSAPVAEAATVRLRRWVGR